MGEYTSTMAAGDWTDPTTIFQRLCRCHKGREWHSSAATPQGWRGPHCRKAYAQETGPDLGCGGRSACAIADAQQERGYESPNRFAPAWPGRACRPSSAPACWTRGGCRCPGRSAAWVPPPPPRPCPRPGPAASGRRCRPAAAAPPPPPSPSPAGMQHTTNVTTIECLGWISWMSGPAMPQRAKVAVALLPRRRLHCLRLHLPHGQRMMHCVAYRGQLCRRRWKLNSSNMPKVLQLCCLAAGSNLDCTWMQRRNQRATYLQCAASEPCCRLPVLDDVVL